MMQEYFIYSLLGALLFMLIYHFSLYENKIICALIPALPILGIFGLFLISEKKKDVLQYLTNIIVFFILYLFLFSLMYLLYLHTSNLPISIGISLTVWMFFTICYIFFDK